MPNWKSKTTIAGLLAGLAILFAQASHYLDDDPATVVDLAQVIAAFSLFGIGWSARDR